MAVWAFACKVESSMNRWFDGTDQDVFFTEDYSFTFDSAKSDSFEALDSQDKRFFKNISQMKVGIGTQLLNTTMLNGISRRISDFDDAVFPEDVIDIGLSRELLHLADTIYAVEHFNKTIEPFKVDSFGVHEGTFILENGLDATTTDNAPLSDYMVREFSRTVTGDSVSFTEIFDAKIGGKSFYDNIKINEVVTKDISNTVGDENRANPLNSSMLNTSMIGEESDEPTIVTTIGLTEEVQIILT